MQGGVSTLPTKGRLPGDLQKYFMLWQAMGDHGVLG